MKKEAQEKWKYDEMMNFFEYKTLLVNTLDKLNFDNINAANLNIFRNIVQQNPIILFGNGGSASIANHWVTDLSKGISEDTNFKCKAYSLSSNYSLITAIANDIGYEYIYERQLEYLQYHKGIAVAISSSGNSENIVKAVKKAKELGLFTIGLTGFTGGKVKDLVDISIHVSCNNYGVVEDIHMMILHSISQNIRSLYNNKNDIKL